MISKDNLEKGLNTVLKVNRTRQSLAFQAGLGSASPLRFAYAWPANSGDGITHLRGKAEEFATVGLGAVLGCSLYEIGIASNVDCASIETCFV